MVQIATYTAPPLAYTFLLARFFQVVCFIPILGMAGNFVSIINSSWEEPPPREIVATVAITAVCTLYSLLTVPFFLSPSSSNLTLLLITAVDGLFLISFLVISVLLGQPLSYLNCFVLGDSNAYAVHNAAFYNYVLNLDSNGDSASSATADLLWFASGSKSYCLQAKSVWGLCCALCILYAVCVAILPTLWFKARRAARAEAQGKA